MASPTYLQYYADRPPRMVRRTKQQGAPKKPEGTRKVRKNMTFSPSGYKIAKDKAAQLGMSVSAFYELAGVLYNIGVYDNCSKQ